MCMQEQKHLGMTLIIVIHQAQSGAFASPYLAEMAHSLDAGRCIDVIHTRALC